MAQPARALDTGGAAANLRRSQVAARRDQAAPKKRGQVLEFPGGRPLGRGAASSGTRPVGDQLREAEVYQFPTSQQERSAQETQNRERWNRDKIQSRQRYQDFVRPPAAYRELSRDIQQEPEMMTAYQEFRAETAAIATQDRLASSAQRNRLMTARRLAQASRQFSERIQKIKQAIQAIKKGKDVAWTAYEVVSLAETEGALVETVNVSGVFVSLYRGMKTVIMPQAQFSNDPDAGQFFKGLLSFAEPSIFRVKDITAWLGGLHAMYGYISLFIIFGGFLAILVIIAAQLMLWQQAYDAISGVVSAATGSGGTLGQSVSF